MDASRSDFGRFEVPNSEIFFDLPKLHRTLDDYVSRINFKPTSRVKNRIFSFHIPSYTNKYLLLSFQLFFGGGGGR